MLPELEIMEDGILQISANTLVFISFKGKLEENISLGFNFTYNSTTHFLERCNASTNGQHVNRIKLLELNKTKLVYQLVIQEYIIDYQFIRAQPEHLICGYWKLNHIAVPNSIQSASSDKKNAETNLEKTLFEKFRRTRLEIEIGNIGYTAMPNEMNVSHLKWSLSGKTLHLTFDDDNSLSIRVVSIAYNELIIELPYENYTMVMTFDRR